MILGIFTLGAHAGASADEDAEASLGAEAAAGAAGAIQRVSEESTRPPDRCENCRFDPDPILENPVRFRTDRNGLCFDNKGFRERASGSSERAVTATDHQTIRAHMNSRTGGYSEAVSPPLGMVAESNGACHGNSAIMASFFGNVRFQCDGDLPGDGRLTELARRAHWLYNNHCRERVTIPGACHLHQLCERRIDLIRRITISANATRTTSGADGGASGLEALRDALFSRGDEARINMEFIAGVRANLRAGRTPLFYHRSSAEGGIGHVMVATGFRLEPAPPAVRETRGGDCDLIARIDVGNPGYAGTEHDVLLFCLNREMTRAHGERYTEIEQSERLQSGLSALPADPMLSVPSQDGSASSMGYRPGSRFRVLTPAAPPRSCADQFRRWQLSDQRRASGFNF